MDLGPLMSPPRCRFHPPEQPVALSHRQRLCELPVNLADQWLGKRAFCLELEVQLLGPEGLNAASGERSSEQGPVGFDKAEHTVDRDVAVEMLSHHGDLLEHSVDEFGAVARTDEQSFDARSEEAAVDLEVGRPRYFLASMTYTPLAVTTRWSMFAVLRGMRRSCSTRTLSEAMRSSPWPSRSSPMAPTSHAVVDRGWSVTPRIKPPSFGCLARIR